MWQKPIKKTIYTFNINNYSPEITELTYPFMRFYASKIGAEFKIVTERKFPDMPVVYEKLQAYELAQKDANDWNIIVDSDCLIHPEAIDFTLFLNKDTVAQNDYDMANVRWKSDRFFQRDGRYVGTANWFTVFSDMCIELVKPIDDMTLDEIRASIYPRVAELSSGASNDHFVDDFVISRNVAKYGLKYTTIKKKLVELGFKDSNFFMHRYLISTEEKVKSFKDMIASMNLDRFLK